MTRFSKNLLLGVAVDPINAEQLMAVLNRLVRGKNKGIVEKAPVAEQPRGITESNYVLAANHLIKAEADIGIFLAEAYDDLSAMVKNQLKVLVRSQIGVMHQALMIGPRLLDRRAEIQNLLVEMSSDEKGRGVLQSLSVTAWEKVDHEAMEFMIDPMDTLNT